MPRRTQYEKYLSHTVNGSWGKMSLNFYAPAIFREQGEYRRQFEARMRQVTQKYALRGRRAIKAAYPWMPTTQIVFLTQARGGHVFLAFTPTYSKFRLWEEDTKGNKQVRALHREARRQGDTSYTGGFVFKGQNPSREQLAAGFRKMPKWGITSDLADWAIRSGFVTKYEHYRDTKSVKPRMNIKVDYFGRYGAGAVISDRSAGFHDYAAAKLLKQAIFVLARYIQENGTAGKYKASEILRQIAVEMTVEVKNTARSILRGSEESFDI